MFACHKTAEAKEIACAGWLAVAGWEHLGVRLAVITARLPRDALNPGDDWPDLFGSYEGRPSAEQPYPEARAPGRRFDDARP
jgi:hypothetical protein